LDLNLLGKGQRLGHLHNVDLSLGPVDKLAVPDTRGDGREGEVDGGIVKSTHGVLSDVLKLTTKGDLKEGESSEGEGEGPSKEGLGWRC
jgi:hypothetical protein